MKVLVTGSTGFLGVPLCLELARRGIAVNALARSVSKSTPLRHPMIEVVQGDVLAPESLEKAAEGCDCIFHLAAYTKVWESEPNQSRKINVGGTENVLLAAQKAGVKRVVITSTAGVIGPSPQKGVLVDEETNPHPVLTTEYERTKLESERLALTYVEKGIDVVITNPTRIFGPGPLTPSNSVTRVVKTYGEGKWRFIPGDGKSIGNYVYLDDVVKGLILAMEKGVPGERYILGGSNLSYLELFALLSELTGKRQWMLNIPLGPMQFFALTQVWLAKWFKIPPLITPEFVKKYSKDWLVSSKKAQTELGYSVISIQEGLEKTWQWLQHQAQD